MKLRIPKPGMELGQGAIMLCAVLWSTSGLCITLLDWHPVVIAGLRSFIAALFLRGIRICFPRRVQKTSSPALILIAGTAYAGTMLTFVVANKLTSSANAILLQYTAPVWAAFLGRILIKERLRREHIGALILVMTGLIVFFKDSLGGGSLAGDGIALCSGLFFGSYSVLLRMQKDGNPGDAMLCSHILCACFAAPFGFLYPPSFSPAGAGTILYMGTLQIGAASLLFAYGIKRVSALQAMLTAMIEPVLNPIWVLAVTGEIPSFSTILGGGLIITAVTVSPILASLKKR